ncbi:MAG: hypothetical protein M0Z54_01250 [Thermaerobacter sp.]|nr:hypothetical protein [Thermaerobacter sp.]
MAACAHGEAAGAIETGVADAGHVGDPPDHSADAVLLVGPLYHLRTRPERLQARREARRMANPGALIFRWSARIDAYIGQKLAEAQPDTTEQQLSVITRIRWIVPLMAGGFTAYTHGPRQLWADARVAGIEPLALVGIEGVGYLRSALEERWRDPTGTVA